MQYSNNFVRLNLHNQFEAMQRTKALRLFSKYDEGVRINKTMMYSITKEVIANKIAEICKQKGYKYVVDGCSGAGGNTIAFASHGIQTASVEYNQENLYDCIHNSEIYGVNEDIQFFHGDITYFDCLKETGFDPAQTLFFCSPEWGGPNYIQNTVFDLEQLQPRLTKLLKYARETGYAESCYYLPRSSDLEQLERNGCTEVNYMFQAGLCDAICAWFN